MAKSEDKFQIVYRGQRLVHFKFGGLVFFQRPIESGGGFWLGRTYDFVFVFEIHYPVSIAQGMKHIMLNLNDAPTFKVEPPEDFELE